MPTSEWLWYLERFGDDDNLIEECEVPAGIALELLHGRETLFSIPACYKLAPHLFLSAVARENGE